MDAARPTSTIPGETGSERRPVPRGVAVAAFSVSALLFFTLQLQRVWSTSVDVVFWDHWEIFVPFFEGKGLWAAFHQQFGPHRQGVGALVIAASNSLSGWDMRVLSVVTVCVLASAMLVAVRLKIVLYGELTMWDALIPPLFFRLSQSQAIASVANPAHGALPILFIVCCCLALSIESRAKQLLILVPLAYVTVSTGFSHLFLPVMFVILLMRAITELVAGRRRAGAFTALTILGIVCMELAFLSGYSLNGTFLDCKGETREELRDYVAWVVTQFSHYWGLADADVPLLVTAGVILGLLSWLAFATVRGARREEGSDAMRQWARYSVPLALIAYSLAFSLASAYGRLCGGIGFALSSRYVTHMIPLGLGSFFVLLLGVRRAAGTGTMAAGVNAVGVLFAACCLWGAVHVSSADRLDSEVELHAKLRWAECVRGGGSAIDCEARTHFSAYPYLELLDARIDYLRARKLSLFSPDWSNPDAGSGKP